MKDNTILDQDTLNENDNQSFETYKTFASREQADDYIELLKQHNIPYSDETPQLHVSSAITGSAILPKVVLKLRPDDFPDVDALIEQQILESGKVPEDYYLKELNDNELRAVLEKSDEWSIQDVSMARLILKERGIHISGKEIEDLRENRIREIRQGKKANRSTMLLYFLGIVFGFYFFQLLGGPIGGGLWISGLAMGMIPVVAGIGMGFYYTYDKSTDPNGYKYYTFEPTTRKYGKLMVFWGIPLFLLTFIIFLFLPY